MNNVLLLSLGILLIFINTLVTVAVFRSDSYETRQKFLQFFIIWLIPIVGSALLWLIVQEENTKFSFKNDSSDCLSHDDYFDHRNGSDIEE